MKNKFDKYDWMVMALFALLAALIFFLMLSGCSTRYAVGPFAQDTTSVEVYQSFEGGLFEQVDDTMWRVVK